MAKGYSGGRSACDLLQGRDIESDVGVHVHLWIRIDQHRSGNLCLYFHRLMSDDPLDLTGPISARPFLSEYCTCDDKMTVRVQDGEAERREHRAESLWLVTLHRMDCGVCGGGDAFETQDCVPPLGLASYNWKLRGLFELRTGLYRNQAECEAVETGLQVLEALTNQGRAGGWFTSGLPRDVVDMIVPTALKMSELSVEARFRELLTERLERCRVLLDAGELARYSLGQTHTRPSKPKPDCDEAASKRVCDGGNGADPRRPASHKVVF